jgi:hypothetical protein
MKVPNVIDELWHAIHKSFTNYTGINPHSPYQYTQSIRYQTAAMIDTGITSIFCISCVDETVSAA